MNEYSLTDMIMGLKSSRVQIGRMRVQCNPVCGLGRNMSKHEGMVGILNIFFSGSLQHPCFTGDIVTTMSYGWGSCGPCHCYELRRKHSRYIWGSLRPSNWYGL